MTRYITKRKMNWDWLIWYPIVFLMLLAVSIYHIMICWIPFYNESVLENIFANKNTWRTIYNGYFKNVKYRIVSKRVVIYDKLVEMKK